MIWKSGSSKTDAQLDVVVNRIRKWRTLSLKVGFSFVIAKDIIMGNKPHELVVGPELSAWAEQQFMEPLPQALRSKGPAD